MPDIPLNFSRAEYAARLDKTRRAMEAAGVELQHAIQKVAVPESQATGQEVHGVVRHYQKLTEQAMARLRKAGRDGLFPTLDDRSIADLAHRLGGTPDRAFIMGGAVAGAGLDEHFVATLDQLGDT